MKRFYGDSGFVRRPRKTVKIHTRLSLVSGSVEV